MFCSLTVPDSITTGYQSPNSDFFIPVLKSSSTFKIGVGYFTSQWLHDVQDGIKKFSLRGGTSQWLISPNLTQEDADIIFSERKGDYAEEKLLEDIHNLPNTARTLLANLIISGALEFKIALPKTKSSNIYHAKNGVFYDAEKNTIAFNGSFNLTSNASSNWEYIDIFSSNNLAEKKRIDSIEQRFDALWNGDDPIFDSYEPSLELYEKVKRFTDSSLGEYQRAQFEQKVKLRPYQTQAIESWGNNNGRGIFQMATGSGKTFTALATIKKLIDIVVKRENRPLVIVVVLPLKHLLEQWYDEAKVFDLNGIKCYESSKVWTSHLSRKLANVATTREGFVLAFVTNSTLCTTNFQKIISNISIPFMFVADEAHNLGSKSLLEALPQNANYRLGLTATPDRHNDVLGTQALFSYFGEPVIDFTLKDAINAGFLTKYYYYPHICEMSWIEFDRYQELTEEIEVLNNSRVDAALLESKKAERTDLIAGVSNKLEILRNLLKEHIRENNISHTLIYCGTHKDAEDKKHITRVTKLLGKELDISIRKFTSEESSADRKDILKMFSDGEIETIAAIRCLDEGVDVPATKNAFILASTTNPKEFIQRRGRVLRKFEGKEFAAIHDFIVVPPVGAPITPSLILREVSRGREYNEIAENSQENQKLFDDLLERNGVEIG